MARNVDLVILAKKIYAVDGAFSRAEAMAVDSGRVVALGGRDEIAEAFSPRRRLDFGEGFVYPGFMDPHCHFLSYGLILQRAWLFEANSWEATVAILAAHRDRLRASGAGGGAGDAPLWVQGRGWDQNRWAGKAFPTRELLDRAFPSEAVLAIRVDGHAAMANGKALEAAGIGPETRVDGGTVVLSQGLPTGLLLDNAVDLVKKAIPQPDEATMRRALAEAQANCLAVGLAAVSNAGTERREALLMKAMQEEGALRLGLYVMLAPTDENIAEFAASGPLVTERMSIRSFKMFADGALGSRGARLLEPYADDPGNFGLFTLDPDELDRVCGVAASRGFQMNVHAIGDAAARLVLDAYGRRLKPGNDLRWRVEHAQLVHDADLARFRALGVIPSVQTTHATSDMAWTEARLGADRMARSHRYRDLLAQNGWLANGSDFPIEGIDPLRGFRAAVFRKDDRRRPEGGYRASQALSRIDALRAMTLWAARANFEEGLRGSLEPGKLADFTALDVDLLEDPEERLWEARVLATGIGGGLAFERIPS
ncbi:amidohydrolase [bacterium]|nr:amidohydrolase [bacterium]